MPLPGALISPWEEDPRCPPENRILFLFIQRLFIQVSALQQTPLSALGRLQRTENIQFLPPWNLRSLQGHKEKGVPSPSPETPALRCTPASSPTEGPPGDV